MTRTNRSTGPTDEAMLNRRRRADESNVGPIPEPRNKPQRRACEKDLQKFLTRYMKTTFYLKFCEDQITAIKNIEHAVLDGGLGSVAMPRGFGKTSISEGAAIWGMLYGHIRFGVVISSDQKAAEAVLADIKIELETNELLQEDFPEVCLPIEMIEGRAQRCASQHIDGEPTRLSWKTNRIVLPTVPRTPYTKACGHVLQAKGLTAGIRGLHFKNNDEKIRPDFALLDDPQTRESAKSVEQTKAREEIIRGDVMGLAGHDRTISALMLCTVIETGDLAERFLDREANPEWRGHRTRLVYSWGKKIGKERYTNSKLWEEYHAIWKRCKINGTMKEANAFYKANRKKMDEGVKVASPYFFDKGQETSAVQHAFHLLYKMGERAFLAECQNQPPDDADGAFKITPEEVRTSLSYFPKRTAPKSAQFMIAMVDVNYLGLNYAVTAFDSTRAGWIVEYGKYPEGNKWLWSKAISERTGLTEEQAVYKAVMEFGERLFRTLYHREDGTSIFFNAIMFDANYMTDTVAKACAALSRKLNFQIWTSRSRPTKTYRTGKGAKVMKRAQDVHLEKNDRGFECVYVSDRWQKDAQQGFKLTAGSPLSLSLYGKKPEEHERMGDEICSQQLLQLLRGEMHDAYTWSTPNGRNDLLDGVKGTIAAAALLGAGQAGDIKRRRKKRHKKPKQTRIKI